MTKCRVDLETDSYYNQVEISVDLRKQFDNETDTSEMAKDFLNLFPEHVLELIIECKDFQTYLDGEFNRWREEK